MDRSHIELNLDIGKVVRNNRHPFVKNLRNNCTTVSKTESLKQNNSESDSS